jgi:hypothetical protein
MSRRKSASGAPLQERKKRHRLVCQTDTSSVQVAGVATQPYGRFPMTTQRRGRRALTLAVRAPPLAKLLHHVLGHDRNPLTAQAISLVRAAKTHESCRTATLCSTGLLSSPERWSRFKTVKRSYALAKTSGFIARSATRCETARGHGTERRATPLIA